MILILISLGFTGVYNLSKFRKNLEDSLLQTYAIAGSQGVRFIEYSVRYGKDLERFFGIQELLLNIKQLSSSINDIHLFDTDKNLLYTTGVKENIKTGHTGRIDTENDSGAQVFMSEDEYHIILPIHGKSDEVIGFIDIATNPDNVVGRIGRCTMRMLFYLALVLVLAPVILLLYSIKGPLFKESQTDTRLLRNVLVVTLMAAQIFFCLQTFMEFNREYRSVARENAGIVNNALKNDLESVIQKGVTYDKLNHIETYFSGIIDSIQGIHSISIVSDDTPVYQAQKQEKTVLSEDVSAELLSDGEKQSYHLSIKLSEDNIRSKLFEVLLDTLTALIVSIIFMIEVAGIITLSINRVASSKTEKGESGYSIRSLAFVAFMATTMYVSFIPIISKQLYVPTANIPENIMIGMPYTAEMLFGVIATIVSGIFIDKLGWKKVFSVGCVFLILGNALSALTPALVLFSLFRGIAGLGFGLLLMSVRALVLMSESVEERNKGIAGMNVGGSSGATCGVVIGAMISDRAGFAPVFLISAILITAIMVIMIVINRSGVKQDDKARAEAAAVADGKKSLSVFRFLGSAPVLLFILLVIIPSRLGRAFLNYYFPLFASDKGISQSVIGQVFMVSSLCSIFLSSFVIKYSNRFFGIRMTMVFSLLVMGGSVLIFAYTGNIITAVIAIILLSVLDKSLMAASTNHYLGLDRTKWFGEGKAMSIFGMSEKIGDTVSPALYGGFIATGIVSGTGFIGAILAAGGILFIIVSMFSKKAASKKET